MANKEFTIDGVEFVQAVGAPKTRGTSSDNKFVIVKTDNMIDFYRELATRGETKTIFEIGMYEGGSLVWMDKIFRPERLVGLDIRREPIAALEAYRADRPHITTYYGRSQSGPGTRMAANECFPDGIDMVIDDASHLYGHSRTTFQTLFPMVRPGGKYILEDWGWSFHEAYQGPDGTWAHEPALANLLIEILGLSVISPAVAHVEIIENVAAITRGPGAYRPEMLDALSERMRGREMPLL